ncbi:MAG TPA: hypothetical protein VM846_18290 [Vicinamibacterales bacterium]|jgi:hypothetical protein|nr:hypothetical protein [Vicinamibacterales bacterium]
MKIFVTLVICLCYAVPSALEACGDKFFQSGASGRGALIYAAKYPAKILIYAGGAPAASRELRDNRLEKHFTKAGHAVQVVESPEALNSALQSGTIDLVFTDYDSAVAVSDRVASVSTGPALIGASTEGVKPAKTNADTHRFTVVKASDKITGLLSKIDDAMKTRVKSGRQRKS